MQQLKQKLSNSSIAEIYFELKRQFYQLRYPHIRLEKGVRIAGSFCVNGNVRLTIKAGSRLRKNVLIEGTGEITIGKNVLLNGCWICGDSAISIGDDCLISDCFIVDTNFHNIEPHLRHSPPTPKVKAPIQIDRNVWIGARATVLKGVHIGADSVVGLGCIVRKSIPAGVVVIGDPQQIVKEFDRPDDRADRSIDELPVFDLGRF